MNLLVLALLGVVTIDQDTTVGAESPVGEEYHVVGDATLTIEGGSVGKIQLFDNSRLVQTGGRIRGDTYVWGHNDLQFLGGRHEYEVVGNGDSKSYVADGYGLGERIQLL